VRDYDQCINTFPSPALTTQTIHGRGCALGGLQGEPFLMLNAKVSHARGTEIGVGSPQGCASWQVTCQTPSQLETWDASASHRNATCSQGAQQTAVAFLYSSSFSPCPQNASKKTPCSLPGSCWGVSVWRWAGGPVVEMGSGESNDWHRGTWMIASEEQRG